MKIIRKNVWKFSRTKWRRCRTHRSRAAILPGTDAMGHLPRQSHPTRTTAHAAAAAAPIRPDGSSAHPVPAERSSGYAQPAVTDRYVAPHSSS